MGDAALLASFTASSEPVEGEIAGFADLIGYLEVRADLTDEAALGRLRRTFAGRLLYSLRSRSEGGARDQSAVARHERLIAAAQRYDFVDLEAARDLVPLVLEHIPAARRVISWHGSPTDSVDFSDRLAAASAVQARLYRMVPFAARPTDALSVLRRLESLRRRDVMAFASGAAGVFTRVLAPRLGAPLAAGVLAGGALAAGELTIAQLVEDFGLPDLAPIRALFGIVSAGAHRSPSPRLHNGAYRAGGVTALYLPFYAERFSDLFCEEVLGGFDAFGTPLGGLTVTAPHKESALSAAEQASTLARASGGANAFVRRGASWLADTTDPDGVMSPLLARGVDVRGRSAVVVGCGGAGRAAAVALRAAGARVTLANRGQARGQYAAGLLGMPFVPRADLAVGDFSLVINATPCVGDGGTFSFDVTRLARDAVVVDLVSRAIPTPLVCEATLRGHLTIDGGEVLLAEVKRQYYLMTGLTMPEARPSAVAARAGSATAR